MPNKPLHSLCTASQGSEKFVHSLPAPRPQSRVPVCAAEVNGEKVNICKKAEMNNGSSCGYRSHLCTTATYPSVAFSALWGICIKVLQIFKFIHVYIWLEVQVQLVSCHISSGMFNSELPGNACILQWHSSILPESKIVITKCLQLLEQVVGSILQCEIKWDGFMLSPACLRCCISWEDNSLTCYSSFSVHPPDESSSWKKISVGG